MWCLLETIDSKKLFTVWVINDYIRIYITSQLMQPYLVNTLIKNVLDYQVTFINFISNHFSVSPDTGNTKKEFCIGFTLIQIKASTGLLSRKWDPSVEEIFFALVIIFFFLETFCVCEIFWWMSSEHLDMYKKATLMGCIKSLLLLCNFILNWKRISSQVSFEKI